MGVARERVEWPGTERGSNNERVKIMATANVTMKRTAKGYEVKATIGGRLYRKAVRANRMDAEVEGDVMESELEDAGYTVTVNVCK